jgi:hypothetical protein
VNQYTIKPLNSETWDALASALRADGFQTIPGPPPDQQLDVAKDGEEMSFGWLARGRDGQVVLAGGPYAGEPWPEGMLDWPPGRIGSVQCPIISPYMQIEIKEMTPTRGAWPSPAPERR